MLNKFLHDEQGDTNIVSIIIILTIVIIAIFLFKPYIAKLSTSLLEVFM